MVANRSTPITTFDQLRRLGVADGVTSGDLVALAANGLPTFAFAAKYGAIVAELAAKRRLASVGESFPRRHWTRPKTAPRSARAAKHNLPQVIEALTGHLTWLWHVVLVQPGQESRIMGRNIHNGHRDLLAPTAGAYRPRRWLRDTLTSKLPAQDKSLHPWQQAAEAPRYLIDLLCPEDGLVVDPCCGAGTFGAVALASGRRFLGVDIDPTTLTIAAERLAQAVASDGPEDQEPSATGPRVAPRLCR